MFEFSKIKAEYPISIQWKIVKHRLEAIKKVSNNFFTSTNYRIPCTDIQYSSLIYPNGDNEERRGETWIYLHLHFEKPKDIQAEYTVSIKSRKISKTFFNVFENTKRCGFYLCTTEELFNPQNRYFNDYGVMIIKFDGCLRYEKEVPVLSFERAGNSLGVNLWNQENKDFKIVADGKEIEAHKCVLSACSPVFSAMLKPHTQEAQQNQVTIPDFPHDIIEIAIKLCYDHSLVNEISYENQLLLLQFFDKYDIQSLKTKLERYLMLIVDESNVCRLTNCSIACSASSLKMKCHDFLLSCLKTKPICDFDILDKEFAMDLLKNAFCPICD